MQNIILDTNPSQRYEDSNGFLCIRHNPIAKAGVFEYLGESLGMTGNDAKRIYKVYRPFDELKKTAKDFEGMPITLDHHWVEGDHRNPTVMGIISGKVTAEEPYLYADIKIINDEASKAIDSGVMRELSPGYTSDFIEEQGVFNGEDYGYRQMDMHYNHLALVEVGRSGPDLRIIDADKNNITPYINKVEASIKSLKANVFKSVSIDDVNDLLMEMESGIKEIKNLLKSDTFSHQSGVVLNNMMSMLSAYIKYDLAGDSIVEKSAKALLQDMNKLERILKSNKIIDGGKEMPKTLKIEDVNIDKLVKLLVDFFEEEKQEGAHNDATMADDTSMFDEENILIGDEDIDAPVGDEDIDIPTKDNDAYVDVPSDDNDIPTKDNDAPVDDENIDDKVERTVDAAIASYKKAHAKAMIAYDEVSPVVGSFKTYDSAGNALSEKSIYKLACNRLGLSNIKGISDYKSAFKAAAYIQSKVNNTNARVVDTIDEADDGTIDTLIKTAFRK